MRLPSPEELAGRWRPAHTVALAAWCVVAVLGVALLFKGDGNQYPATNTRKVYAAENATFKYPANWIINDCESGKPFIELPGTIGSDYKDRTNYPLVIYGTGAFTCMNNRPERLDIYPEQIVASEAPCVPSTSTRGEHLANGLYLQLQEQAGWLAAVHIKQNSCFAPRDTVVLGFAFADPQAQAGDNVEYGMPGVSKEEFLKSRQYQDIRALAESISY